MRDLTVGDNYQRNTYLIITNLEQKKDFIKLVEEVGEVAEVFEWALWSKRGGSRPNLRETLAKELADIIQLHRRIAAINHIDLLRLSLRKTNVFGWYQHERDLEGFWR